MAINIKNILNLLNSCEEFNGIEPNGRVSEHEREISENIKAILLGYVNGLVTNDVELSYGKLI